MKRQFPEAEDAAQRAEKFGGPAMLPTRAFVWALQGRRDEAIALLTRIDGETPIAAGPAMIRAWAAAGEVDEAIRWANRLFAESPDYGRISIDVPPDPVFEKLRRDPRYLDVRRKLGLPPLMDKANTSTAAR